MAIFNSYVKLPEVGAGDSTTWLGIVIINPFWEYQPTRIMGCDRGIFSSPICNEYRNGNGNPLAKFCMWENHSK